MTKQNAYYFGIHCLVHRGFPGGSAVKNLPANAGDKGSVLGLGRFPGGGNGNPLQYSCLENSMDRGARKAIVHGVSKSIEKARGMPKCGTGIIVNVLPAVVGRTCLRVIILN